MKNIIVLFLGLLLLHCTTADCKYDEARKDHDVDYSMSIFCSPDLYDLTVSWVEAYRHIHPDVTIEVINTAGSTIDENIILNKKLGFVSSGYPVMYEEPTWNLLVGRDVIVPIFNSKNPFAKEISQQGISLEGLAQILQNPGMNNWATLLNKQENIPVNLYVVDDESINVGLAKMLGLEQFTANGLRVENGKELISSVQEDPYSIGLCKITDINGLDNQIDAGNILLLPIDRNSNGKIDHMEKIYDDQEVLARGVWIGKYPKSLINNLYFISTVKPANETEIAFLTWVLTDGQQFLNNYGYSDLLFSERQKKLDLFNDHKLNIITPEENFAATSWLLLIMISFAAIVLIMIAANLHRINNLIKKEGIPEMAFVPTQVLDEHFVDAPMGLYYDKTHTWAYMEKEGTVRIGIDDFLQHVTGPLTRVRLKKEGEKIRKGEPALSIIQNGKQLNIHAPVSGTIKEQNKVLKDAPSLLNSSPYSDGWVYMIEPTNWIKETQFLTMWEKYKEWLKGEFSRLKDFLATSVKPNVEYAHILQDGGEIKDGILMDFGPKVWEDFQSNFIDLSI